MWQHILRGEYTVIVIILFSQSIRFKYFIVAPEVTVEQLKNDSLFCNVTGIPNSYTFSKWEHHSIDGYHLRTLESRIPSLLTIDNKHDKPIYTIDGRYQCNVSNGVTDEKNLTFQNGYKDVYFPGNYIISSLK